MNSDFLIAGSGIIGLTVARALSFKYPDASITILEKEPETGRHSSGRNSGVLHSGIYYPPESYKAEFTRSGRIALTEYCLKNDVPFRQIGKIIIPTDPEQKDQLELLYERGIQNGVTVSRLDAKELAEREPLVKSATGSGLFIEDTSIADPVIVLKKLSEELKERGVKILFNEKVTKAYPAKNLVQTEKSEFTFRHFINCAGLYADRVAHMFDTGGDYTILPFKGIYWKLNPDSEIEFNHLVYPVPDLRVPFLGVHTTTNTSGDIYFGPTAVPAFSRENYKGLQGLNLPDLSKIIPLLGLQFLADRDGFRMLARQEGVRYFKRRFILAAQAIVPSLKSDDLISADKIGIRAQMYQYSTKSLVNDFVIEKGENSTHILNAISPAWTCSFPFAEMAVRDI